MPKNSIESGDSILFFASGGVKNFISQYEAISSVSLYLILHNIHKKIPLIRKNKPHTNNIFTK